MNSVFASVALPVSVNVRGTNLNQVYIGQFRPDVAKSPRWFGNLKMYKIGQDASGDAFLVDVDGNRAENAATGFISPNAKSFWTTGSTFWNHRAADENGTGGRQTCRTATSWRKAARVSACARGTPQTRGCAKCIPA